MVTDRRSRKRLATRQTISDIATRLFIERGFDTVTIDEIAEAADVGRMTVFNHFSRKEDLFFDRDEEGREVLRTALRDRDPNVSPIEALRLLAYRAVHGDPPYVNFFPGSKSFVEAVEKSPTLIARARAIRDELTKLMTVAFAESVGRAADDPEAHLAANLLLATWTTAFIQAHRAYQQYQDAEQAKSIFLKIIDQGTAGLASALAGTPYVLLK